MTFNDILKSSFLEKAVDFSILDVTIAMLLSFVLGLFIFMVYKKTFAGVMYSASFGVSLMAMTLITTLVILAVTSNVILSLGMVGALSIVRFRTAVKEPLDIAFLFWSITAGIVIGAGLIPLAIIGTAVIGIFLILFANRKATDTPYIVIVNCDTDKAVRDVTTLIEESTKKHLLKSKSLSKSGYEMTMEVRLKEMSTEFIDKMLSVTGVTNAVLVSYNGEYMA